MTIKLIPLCVTVFISLLQACASISSQKIVYKGIIDEGIDGIGDGAVYFVPKRPIRITYTISQNKDDKNKSDINVSVDDTNVKDMVPDTTNMFLLRYNKNYVGKNHMFMHIDRNGLLSISHADTVSRMGEIIKNAAKDAAALSFGAAPQSTSTGGQLIDHNKESYYKNEPSTLTSSISKVSFTTSEKCYPGNYDKLIEPDKDLVDNGIKNIPIFGCNIKIQLKRDFPKDKYTSYDSDRLKSKNLLYRIYNALDIFHWQVNTGNSLPGLFYREEKPYKITITANDAEYHLTALSPNESGIYFAPISKTLFSANTSDITLVNGVIKTMEETTESEIWEISKAPADFIGEYTHSVGQIFDSLKTNTDKEKSLIDKELELSNANSTNNMLQAKALADAQKELINAQRQSADAQAKKQFCDALFVDAKNKKGDDWQKAMDNYFQKCSN